MHQEHLSGDISNHLADVGPMVKNLSTLTSQIQELERYTKYLQWIARVEDLRCIHRFIVDLKQFW